MTEEAKTQQLPEITLGTPCMIKGRHELNAIVASRTLGAKDSKITVILDFEGIPFTCASDGYDQKTNPNTIRLQARVYEGEEDAPQGKLLAALQTLQRLQRRSEYIYGDSTQIADLDKTPIKDIQLEGAIPQRDLSTGKEYTPFIVRVKRESVLPKRN